jgi:CRISPR/Cas system-associated exonuclease Cas4 (RecB family)
LLAIGIMLEYNKYIEVKNIDSPTGRVYDTPEGIFPSITTVLGATANKAWLDKWIASVGEEEATRIKEEAAARGTILHNYLEDFYRENSKPTKEQAKAYIATLKPEKEFIKGMVVNILSYQLANKFESLAQEFVVWDNELKVAGRCDGVGFWNEEFVVIDYKSSRKLKTVSQVKDYYLQATFYCIAHNKLFSRQTNKFVILLASEDGKSQIFTGNAKAHIPELRMRIKSFYDKKARL